MHTISAQNLFCMTVYSCAHWAALVVHVMLKPTVRRTPAWGASTGNTYGYVHGNKATQHHTSSSVLNMPVSASTSSLPVVGISKPWSPGAVDGSSDNRRLPTAIMRIRNKFHSTGIWRRCAWPHCFVRLCGVTQTKRAHTHIQTDAMTVFKQPSRQEEKKLFIYNLIRDLYWDYLYYWSTSSITCLLANYFFPNFKIL